MNFSQLLSDICFDQDHPAVVEDINWSRSLLCMNQRVREHREGGAQTGESLP